MGYNTGTITSATPASALVTAIEAELTAHGGWTLMSTVVISTKTYRVWRCNATNAFGTAFFIFFDFLTDGTGTVLIKAMEDWETGGAAASRARRLVALDASVVPHATNFTCMDTTDYTLDSAVFSNTINLTLNTTGFTWRTQVSADRLLISVSSGISAYVGLFESLMASDPFPLCTMANNYGGLSRMPGVVTGGPQGWRAEIRRYIFDPGTNITVPDPIWGYAVSSRILVGGGSMLYGIFRGFLRNCVVCTAAGAVAGDTITMAGATYTMFPMGGLPIWVENLAA